ncbi:MAG TPA: CSLREA domain-containing protein [Acidimicrobiales bacterium]|nr:CSLREA domain-containing protein [Acidimicrobiales bacterium]
MVNRGTMRRSAVVAVCGLLVAAGAVVGASGAAAANAPIVVTTAADHDDGVCGVQSDCTLREAIKKANADVGADQINFAIDNGGPATIVLSGTTLPPITDAVTIDGSTQPGYAGTPLVVIDGSQATEHPYATVGLDVRAAGSTIRALSVWRFSLYDVLLEGGNDRLEASYIGTLDGTTPEDWSSGATFGVVVSGPGDVVGGTDAGAGNVINGGVSIGGAHASVTVEGNLIGTDASGHHRLGDGGSIRVLGTGIGTDAIRRNVVIGCFGIGLDGDAAMVTDNYVGTEADGDAFRPPFDACGYDGAVGIAADGSSPATIGGPGHGNVIVGYSTGISVTGGSTVLGNFVGTNRLGTAQLGNGIGIDSYWYNEIGDGSAAGANVIAFNGTGVRVGGSDGDARVLRNVIRNNDGLAIDVLNYDNQPGVTPNDSLDVDGITNFPVLLASSDNGGRVVGQLDADTDAHYNVDIYSNATCDPSGHGEAETWLGTVPVTTDDHGHAVFDAHGLAVARSRYLTATATGRRGTSELSACMATPGFDPNDGDLSTAVTSSTSTMQVGARFTVTQSITNHGSVGVPSGLADLQLPDGFQVTSVSTSQGTCPVQTRPHCDLGIVARGATAQVTYQLRASSTIGGYLINATTAGGLSDPNTSNNRATQPVIVTGGITQIVGIVIRLIGLL